MSIKLVLIYAIAGLAMFSVAGRLWSAPQPPTPTCAVIFYDPAPAKHDDISPLIATTLEASGGIRTVERQQIDAILAEQKLQSITAVDGGPQRVTLGKLLRADFLVFLSIERPPSPRLRIVVSETRQGIRLANYVIPYGSPYETEAESAAGLIAQVISRSNWPIDAICAVPPFVSEDLTRENDGLKAAYSTLLEQHLMRRPGFAVVELAEARALEREVAIAGEGVRRPLPIYVLGDYRDQHSGDKSSLTVRLRIMRGTTEIGRREKVVQNAAEAAPFICTSVDDVLSATGTGTTLPTPAGVEAKLLSARAEEFDKVGDWLEAADLAEAGLLLAPDDLPLHRLAAEATGNLLSHDEPLEPVDPDFGTPDLAKLRARVYRAALAHLEFYMSHTVLHWWEERHFVEGVFASANTFHPGEILVSQDEMLAMGSRILSAKLAQGVQDDTPWLLHDSLWGQIKEPKPAAFARRLSICREAGGVFGSEAAVLQFVGTPTDVLDSFHATPDIWHDAIALLAALPYPTCKAASATLDRRQKAGFVPLFDHPASFWNDRNASGGKPITAAVGATSQDKVHLDPIPIHWIPEPPSNQPNIDFDWFSAGAKQDALKTPGGLYMMTEAGIARCVSPAAPGGACFDGRYIWTLGPTRDQCLIVVDTQTGRVDRIGRDQGMGQITGGSNNDLGGMDFVCTPLSPGKICCAGSFGRSWVAIATYTPETGGSVKIILEARDTLNPDSRQAWQDPKAGFHPCWIAAITDGQTAPGHQRVVLSRDSDSYPTLSYYPLVIDPDTGATNVLPQRIDVHPNSPRVVTHDGAIWWSSEDARKRSRSLNVRRLSFPGVQTEMFGPPTPAGHLMFYRGQVNLLANESEMMWWLADTPQGPWRELQIEPTLEQPWLARLRESNFFGLILLSDRYGDKGVAYRVTLPTPAKTDQP